MKPERVGKPDHCEWIAGDLVGSPTVLANYNHPPASNYHRTLSCGGIRRQCTLVSNRVNGGSHAVRVLLPLPR
jgi:hypothetical protein